MKSVDQEQSRRKSRVRKLTIVRKSKARKCIVNQEYVNSTKST